MATSTPSDIEQLKQRLQRSPEERAVIRARVLERVVPGRALPDGKTLEEVFVGALPDDEDDVMIAEAIQKLS
jgi:hypothetical protein